MQERLQSAEANEVSDLSGALRSSVAFLQSPGRMVLTEGSPAAIRTINDAEGPFHSALVAKEEGPAHTYELVMVALSGSLLLLVAVGAAARALRRRCGSRYSSRDLRQPAVVLENVSAANSGAEKISTVELTGPACISYVAEQQTVAKEFAVSEEAASILGLPLFSFAASIAPPDTPPEQ